jgi:hypothetical protein
MLKKLFFISIIFPALMSCGPNEGFCTCDDSEADDHIRWGALDRKGRARAERHCNERASQYNTTCTLTVIGSK